MKRQYLVVFLVVMVSCWGFGVPLQAETYFGYEEFGGTWVDVEKTWTDDSNMCWAAAASNILAWGRWETATYRTGAQIFDSFKTHWANVGGEVVWGYDWWFTGTSYTGVAVPGGGNHWPASDAYGRFHATAGDQMAHVRSYLQSGYGVTLAVRWGAIRHATTVWGYDYDPSYAATDSRYFTHLYVTDSDDGMTGLQRCQIGVDDMGFWRFLSGTLMNGQITMAEGFERRWIPEFAPEPEVIVDANHLFFAKFRLAQPILTFDYRWVGPRPPQPNGDPVKFLIQIDMAGQWVTLYEVLFPYDAQEFPWEEVHLNLDQKFWGEHDLRFLVEGEGMVQLYRLTPIPVPGSGMLLISGILVLLSRRLSWRSKAGQRQEG